MQYLVLSSEPFWHSDRSQTTYASNIHHFFTLFLVFSWNTSQRGRTAKYQLAEECAFKSINDVRVRLFHVSLGYHMLEIARTIQGTF